ncbi:MAG: type II toxin-antitoxin system VapC family toxin [Anaerolineae bacterium]
MNGYVVVDASVWVARLVAGDVFHDSCRRWLEDKRTRGELFLAPSLLLAEVAGAVARRTGEADLARRAAAALKQLEDLRLVEMEAELGQRAADLAATLGLRGADAFYVAVAARLSVPLATLDIDQQGRAAKVVEIWEVEVQ